MRLLNRHQVESLLPMHAAIQAVETGFRRLAAGDVVMPQRAAMEIAPHNGLHLSMPAFVGPDSAPSGPLGDGESTPALEDAGALVIKIVTVYGDNPARFGLPTIQGVLLVHDARTGAPIALMDAEALTAIRTGAAGGVAARYMALPDARILTLFGAGAQAAAQVEAVCQVRPIEQVHVVTRSQGSATDDFCRALAQRLQIEVGQTKSRQEAVAGAHIICTATTSGEPVFDGAWVQPGTHINAVGAYKRTLRELDSSLVARCRIVVDHMQAAKAEAGDIVLAVEEGAMDYAQIVGELGEVVSGRVAGRAHAEEITLFKSVGLAMQDAMTAAYVVAQAHSRGIGTEIEF